MSNENHRQTSPLHVMAISPGIAIGPVHLFMPTSLAVEATKISPGQVEAEQQRLREALATAVEELGELSKHVAQTVGRNEAVIFEAQQLILQDPELLDAPPEIITPHHFSAPPPLHQPPYTQAT